MLWSVIFFIFTIFICAFIETNDKLICNSDKILYLELESVGFFESENLPFLGNSSSFCNLTFALKNDNSSKEYKFSLKYQSAATVLTSAGPYLFWNHGLAYNNLSKPYIATTSIPKTTGGNAYLGFGVFEFVDSNYPLEFTKDKPFLLKDESQIIFLFPSYEYPFINRTYPCIWQFAAPPEYGFKIFFINDNFKIYTKAKLLVENTTETFINTRSFHEGPHYNPDNYIKISLFPGSEIFPEDINVFEFEAYVTIVKKKHERQDKCYTKISGNSTIWTNYNTTYELYENNLQCRYNLFIPPYSEVYVTSLSDFESKADYIIFFDEKNISYSFPSYQVQLFITEFMVFSRYDNTKGNNISFEFISDGSFQQSGFSVNFITINCKCNTPVILCDNQTHFAMENTPFLCGNLRCNYSIQPCPTKFFYVHFVFENFCNPWDTFRIISNNLTIYQISVPPNLNNIVYAKPFLFNTIINSENENILEIVTELSDLVRVLSIKLESLEISSDVNFLLLYDNATHIIDMQVSNNTQIKFHRLNSTKNTTFILYCNLFEDIDIYDNENFTKRLDYKKGNGGCVLNYVWTTASTENVKIYIGNDQTNLFFEFNSATFNNFQLVLLMTDIYTIVVPKKAALLINIIEGSATIHNQHYSILATPFFGTYTSAVSWYYTEEDITTGGTCFFSAKFTTIYYKMSKDDVIFFDACTTTSTSSCSRHYPNKIGDVLIFEKVNLQINYTANSRRSKDDGIIFLVENLGFCKCDSISTYLSCKQ